MTFGEVAALQLEVFQVTEDRDIRGSRSEESSNNNVLTGIRAQSCSPATQREYQCLGWEIAASALELQPCNFGATWPKMLSYHWHLGLAVRAAEAKDVSPIDAPA